MKFEAESGEAEEKLARTFVAIVILAAAGVMLQTAEVRLPSLHARCLHNMKNS